MTPDQYAGLSQRLGRSYVDHRLRIQAERAAQDRATYGPFTPFTNGEWKRWMIVKGLKASGLYARGYQNFRAVRVAQTSMAIANLPPAFDGYRLLQLSDLHIDLDSGLADIIIQQLRGLAYDVMVITGDFRSATSGPIDAAVDATLRIMQHVERPVFAILGNHDFLDMVPPLEAGGIRFLVNESVAITRGPNAIYLAGVDDNHYYATDDLRRATYGIPGDASSILLAHSPDAYQEAAAHGFDLMLSGHTHAGQICLPGGAVIQKNVACPRHMLNGAWRYEATLGYTSPGTGATGVPIRFHCPPEITLHTLRAAAN